MKYLLAIALILVTSSAFAARDLIVCGEQSGKAYYLAEGLSPKEGWVDDGVSKSRITLSVTDDGKYDIWDPAGVRPFSYRAQGCEIIVVDNLPSIEAIVACKGTIDTFRFVIRNNGNITMLYTSNVQAQTWTRMRAFVAQCRKAGDR